MNEQANMPFAKAQAAANVLVMSAVQDKRAMAHGAKRIAQWPTHGRR
jgi:hypothetical protein